MNLPDLEAEALKLPAAERARFAEALMGNLDALSEDENRRLWTEEAATQNSTLRSTWRMYRAPQTRG